MSEIVPVREIDSALMEKDEVDQLNTKINKKTGRGAREIGEKDQKKFPEGGKGWLVVLGAFLISNTTYGVTNAFGVYQVYYSQLYPEVAPSTISLIGALQPTAMYLACIPGPYLRTRLGVRGTIILGSFLEVLSFMMLSLTNQIWQAFLTQGVLFGMGAGLNYLTCISIPSEWFQEKRALALGMIVAGSSVGGVIWPIAVQKLIKDVGFPWANRIIGFIILAELVISAATVKERIPKEKTGFSLNLRVLKNARYLCLILAQCLCFFALFPALFYTQDWTSRAQGVPANLSQYIITILNAMSLFGRVLPGHFADKIGRLNVLTSTVLISGILLLVPYRHGETIPLCFAIFFGFSSGATLSLFPSTVGQLFGIENLGSRLTLFFLGGIPGCLVGPAISGTFVTGTIGIKGFDKIEIFAGVMFIAGGITLILLRFSYSRKLMVFI